MIFLFLFTLIVIMKKIALLWIFLMWSIILSGCNKTEIETPTVETDTNHSGAYENNLVIEWISPAFEEWSLVARITYEDHSDVVVFPKWTWESYFENENDSLPGNTISFKWKVEAIDAAAWTHYYEVRSIDTLKIASYPTKEEVEDLLSSYVYCETDEDCVDFYPGCPLGCSHPVNKEYLDIVTKIANNFTDHQENKCAYRCLAPTKITCENYKCTAINEEKNVTEEDGLPNSEVQEANVIFSK